MTVFINSKQAVLDYTNAANGGTRFTALTVVLSKPYDTSGTRHQALTKKNTFMIVEPGTTKMFKGRQWIYYNRLELGDFARFRPNRPLKCPKPAKAHELLAAIKNYFAINLSVDDIENDSLTLDELGMGTVTIRAKPTSPLWLGSLTFDVIPGGLPFEEYLTVTAPDQLKYPIDNFETGSSAALIAYPIDATVFRDQLLPIEEGLLHGDGLALLLEILTTKDGSDGRTLWNNQAGSTQWSLEGATVFYNGLNEAALPTNPAFKYVIGIELRAGVSIPSGRFYIHYTDPENTDSA